MSQGVSAPVWEGSGRGGSGLRRRMVAASGWSLAAMGASQVLRLASNLLLARLLVPEDFGLAAVVSGVLAGLLMFSDIGLAPAVVRSPRGEDPAFLRTAFTLQAARGAGLWVATCVAAWPASVVYGRPLLWLLPVSGLVALLAGLTSSAFLVASRRMEQRRLAIAEVVSFLAQVVTSVVWALLWPSVWALIGGGLVGAVVRTLISHVWFGGFQDRFRLEGAAARELVRFGRWIFVSTAVTFLSQQADRLVLGVVVPIGVLGVYSMSTMLARLPAEIMSRLTGSVLYPALAGMDRADRSAMIAGLTRARRVLLPACLSSCVGVACLGPALFLAAYKPSYHDAVWMTPALVCALWFGLLQSTVDRALLVTGHTRALAASNAVRAGLAVGAGLGGRALLGMWDAPGGHAWGVTGFILGLGVASLAGYATVAVVLARMGASVWKVDAAATGVLAATVGGVWFCAWRWSSWGLPGGELAGWVVPGSVAAVALTVWAGLRALRELRPGGRA